MIEKWDSIIIRFNEKVPLSRGTANTLTIQVWGDILPVAQALADGDFTVCIEQRSHETVRTEVKRRGSDL